MADTPYLYEFLYRGRAPGAPEPAAWQATLAIDGTDGFGRPTHVEQTVNAAQAAALGFDLGAIVGGINAATLAQAEGLTTQLADVAGQVEDLTAQLAASQAAVTALTAQLAEASSP